jgi:3-carboxy-cis,cis-muconate cycloisomerase
MLAAMVQEDERGLGGWHAEWETLPELVSLAAGALHHLADAVAGLRVDPARMAANLEATRGLVFAEAVQMAVAEKTGRPLAQRLLEAASSRAQAESRPLREVLAADPTVARHVSPDELDRLFDVRRYVAAAEPLVDRVLARHAAARATASEGEA